MTLRTGSQLGRYRLLRDFVGSANARWTFAASEGREFFIKEFQRPKYPPDFLPEPLRRARLARCSRFEGRHLRVLEALRSVDDTSDGVVAPVAFFRHELAYYHVAPRIEPTSLAPGATARLPARERLSLIRGLARAVMALHTQNLVHGDLKPGNVLVNRAAEGGLAPRLIDFDGAYFAGEPPDPDAMEFDQTYMAPEVLDYVQRPAAAQVPKPALGADIFALGLLIHACWTGRPPAPAGPHHYAAEAVRAGEGLRLETHDMHPAVERLMQRALSVDPGARPAPWEIDAAIGIALSRSAATPPESTPVAVFPEPSYGSGRSGDALRPGLAEQGYVRPLSGPTVVIRKSRNLRFDET